MDVIKFLNTHGIDALTNIKKVFIASKNVWILNYEQVPLTKDGFGKYHPVLCQCRNLVVREMSENNWTVMSRSFRRFFNWMEDVVATEEFQKRMAAGQVIAYEKFDGSLITVVYFDNTWHIFTRGSNADSNLFRGTQFVGLADEKEETFGSRVRSLLNLELLNKKVTYVFELCSTNVNVTRYNSVFLALLSANIDGVEIYGDELYSKLSDLGLPDTIKTPEILRPTSIEVLYAQLKTKSPDFEGYVLSYLDHTDGKTVHRMKLKQESYVTLHHSNSKKITILDAVRIVATNETTEVLSYMPEHKDMFDSIQNRLTNLAAEIDTFLSSNRHLSRKEFAVSIPKTAELKWLYFDLYRGKYTNALHGMFADSNHGKIADLFSN